MRFLTGRLAGLLALVCLLAGSPLVLRAANGPIAGASGGASSSAVYIVGSSSGSLSAEKVLTEGTGIDIAIAGGDGGTATLTCDPTEFQSGTTIGDGTQATVTLTLDDGVIGTSTFTSGGQLVISNEARVQVNSAEFVANLTTSGDASVVLGTGAIGSDEILDGSVGRSEINESLLSVQVHATDCTTLTCDAGSDGEVCFEQDSGVSWICDGSGTPAWESRTAQDTGTTSLTYTIDSDAAGTEPADGAGLCIEGGSGDVCLVWDQVNNELDVSGPTGFKLALPDPGDGSRGSTYLDNTSEPSAPASGSTMLYALGGELYKKDNGDGTSERQILTSATGVRLLDKDVTEFILNGDGEGTTPTTVYSFSVPANLMGTTGVLRLRMVGKWDLNTGGAETLTFAVKLGATTLWDATSSAQTRTTPIPLELAFDLANMGATNAQRVGGSVLLASETAGNTAGIGDIVSGAFFRLFGNFRGTAAEDTTSAQTLSVEITLSAVGATQANNIVTIDFVTLELL